MRATGVRVNLTEAEKLKDEFVKKENKNIR